MLLSVRVRMLLQRFRRVGTHQAALNALTYRFADRPHVEELNAIDDLVRLRHGSRLHTSCLHVDEALERPMCSPVSLLRKFMPPDDGLAVRIGELCESLPNIKHGPKIVAESPQVTYHRCARRVALAAPGRTHVSCCW